MRALNREQRRTDLAAMADDGVDVLVIGGGVTGAGVALDAALRGYRVGLVEKRDYASGTSSWSTKLVHGGIRYLPQGDVPLVHEALVERGRLLANAPHLVHPLTFVLPLYADSRRPVGLPVAPPWGVGLSMILNTGLGMYDALAGHGPFQRHRRITAAEVERRAACLKPEGLRSGFLYTDGQTDDTRLVLAILRSAANQGARLANYAAVTGFVHDADGQIAGATVRRTAPGDDPAPLTLRARHVVNATGVFAEEVEALAGGTPRLAIEPSKGVHLVLRREDAAIGDDAIVLPETDDGRIIFLVPWRSRVIVGTTDTGTGDLDHPAANDADVDYLLHHYNRSVRRPLARADVLATFAGYRPLLRLRNARATSRLSRSHTVAEGAGSLISVSGGKLTTYRQMAQEVMDHVDRAAGARNPCATEQWPLAGAEDWEQAQTELGQRATALGLAPATIRHLAASYGGRALAILDRVAADPTLAAPLDPELPAMQAEVAHAVAEEGALTVADVLARRLRLSLEAADHGVAAAARVATMFDGDPAAQVADYAAEVAAHDAGLARPAHADVVAEHP